MLLPKFVVTAYLALQSQKTSTEDYGSVQQIQSPLVQASSQGEAASVGDYVIEINGEPIATEHIDVKIPHGSSVGKSTNNAHHQATTPPHALKNTYVTFDEWDTGKVDPSVSHNGLKLSHGNIYDISEFPDLINTYGIKKFWGIPTQAPYTEIAMFFESQKRSFSYNIGYIYNGTLTAATFDAWWRGDGATKYKLNVGSTWIDNPWKEYTVSHVEEIRFVLTGFYSHHGILAIYDWGYQD